MLERLKKFLDEPQGASPIDPGEVVRLATCVVLLEVARIDEEFSDDERERIVAMLQKRYGLSTDEAAELMDSSTASRAASSDLWKFTNQINEHCPHPEKIEIVEEAWRVVVADGGIHGHESHFMRTLGKLLNLTHPELIEAKVKVLEEERSA